MKNLLNRIFEDVGNKLCKVARICAVLDIIAVIISIPCILWALIDGEEELFFGSIILIAVAIIGIIGTFPLYAFGQITNDIHSVKTNICDIPNSNNMDTSADNKI